MRTSDSRKKNELTKGDDRDIEERLSSRATNEFAEPQLITI
jgi:hypothetical protein